VPPAPLTRTPQPRTHASHEGGAGNTRGLSRITPNSNVKTYPNPLLTTSIRFCVLFLKKRTMSLLYAALQGSDGRISIDEYDASLHRGRITCPACSAPLTARRGALRVHHFAHRAGAACSDTWRPELTEWRRAWLARWARERVERRVSVGGTHPQSQGDHTDTARVADVLTERGTAILLQHSGIAVDALYEREDFFLAATGRLPAWVFDATASPLAVELRGQDFVVARAPCAAWACARGPAFLDTADGLFLVVAQNLARPDIVVARPTAFKTDTVVLPAPPTPAGALPLSLDTAGRRVTASSYLANDAWRGVSRHFRWDKPHHSWALQGAAYTASSTAWLPVAPVGTAPTDPRATLRRDRRLFDQLVGFIDRKRSPLSLPTGDLPAPLEAVRARGVRDLTATIFANVVAWNERLPDVTKQWLGFFRSLGWWACYYEHHDELWVRTSTDHDRQLRVFVHNRAGLDDLRIRCDALQSSGEAPPFALVPPCPVTVGSMEYGEFCAAFNRSNDLWPYMGVVCFRDRRSDSLFICGDTITNVMDFPVITYPWTLMRDEGMWVGMYLLWDWWCCNKMDSTWEEKPFGYRADSNSKRWSDRVKLMWRNALDEL
jgi:hypothetical protein